MLLADVAAVLGRERLRRHLSLHEAGRFMANLAVVTTLASDPPPPIRPCAAVRPTTICTPSRAANADASVTGDSDLLELEHIDIAVITPRELAARSSGEL